MFVRRRFTQLDGIDEILLGQIVTRQKHAFPWRQIRLRLHLFDVVRRALLQHDFDLLDGHFGVFSVGKHQWREGDRRVWNANIRRNITPFRPDTNADTGVKTPSKRIPSIADKSHAAAVWHIALHFRRRLIDGKRLHRQIAFAGFLIIDGIRHFVFKHFVALRRTAVLFPQVILSERAACRHQTAERQQLSCLSHVLSFGFE